MWMYLGRDKIEFLIQNFYLTCFYTIFIVFKFVIPIECQTSDVQQRSNARSLQKGKQRFILKLCLILKSVYNLPDMLRQSNCKG
jgi:hypothetical protein